MLSSMGIVMTPGAAGSSAGAWNCATYGCASASSALSRRAGLNTSSRRSRSSASSLRSRQHKEG